MSKKSRRRNKKILAVLGALGGAALMARNKRNASNSVVEANDNAFDIPAVVTTPKKKPVISTPVSTKTTIMDSMPAKAKKNPLSKRIKKNTNEVFDEQLEQDITAINMSEIAQPELQQPEIII